MPAPNGHVTEPKGCMQVKIDLPVLHRDIPQHGDDLHLSLDNDILPDDNKNIELVIRDFNIDEGGSLKVAKGIKRSEIGRKPPVAATYNLLSEVRKLFRDYVRAEGAPLLADYILSYGGYVVEHSFREKIGIFLETVNQFRPRFETDDRYTVYREGDEAYKCKNIKLRAR